MDETEKSPMECQVNKTARDVDFAKPGPSERADDTGKDSERGGAGCGRVVAQCPLIPIQVVMFAEWLRGEYPGTNVQQATVRFRERIDAGRMHEAWDRLVGRHAACRSRVAWQGRSEPVLEVMSEVSLPFRCEDWRRIGGGTEGESALEAFRRKEVAAGFDLWKPPLMRVALIQVGDEEWVLVWTFHHLVLDGGSLRLLLREVLETYDSLIIGQRDGDVEAPGFPAFAEWAVAESKVSHRDYWKKVLGDVTETTGTPWEVGPTRPDPAQTGFLATRLSKELTQQLGNWCKEQGLTPATVVHGAWSMILSKYSGGGDVVFGVVRDGRHASVRGQDAMAGCFINCLPFRARVEKTREVVSWLKELHEQWQATRQRVQSRPDEVEQGSGLSPGKPLFRSMVVINRASVDFGLKAVRPEWRLRTFDARQHPGVRWCLEVALDPEIELNLLYPAREVTDRAARRLLGHLQTLMEGLVGGAGKRLSQISSLPESEYQQTVREWNATKMEYPSHRCLHELFEDQARRVPDRVAVADDQRRLTYGELDRLSERLAGRLRRLGVGADVPVGICLERSVLLVVGILGIAKAGGCYVPLDPRHPVDRLALIWRESGATVLVTERAIGDRFSSGQARVVVLDEDGDESDPGEEQLGDRTDDIRSSNLAYILFTSGSTGVPKGVAVEHRAVVNFLYAMLREPGLGESDVVLALTTLGFDIATLELWLPLMVGARIFVASDDTRLDPRALETTLRREGVTLLQATPATWKLLRTIGWEGIPGLTALCGGEAVGADLATWIAERCRVLWNMYGPTETTVWSTSARLSPSGGVTIGRPIGNTRVYVVDAHGQPAPVGVSGELWIGGDGVARGYWRRPELTQERFLPDPFCGEEGARVYRTGDLCRWNEAGCIEWLERMDQQVKIRGYRVELSEIEDALKQCEGVRDAVAVVRDPSGDARLVGYLILRDDAKEDADAWRESLRGRLPEYMVPGALVVLDRFPLTPNGKVDRKALPEPVKDSRDAGGSAVSARTPTEEIVLGICEGLLKVRGLKGADNFFDAGGHSLLAMQLASRLEGALGIPVPVRWIFEIERLSELSDRLAGQRRPANGRAAIPCERNGGETDLPLSPAQVRLWFLDQLEPGSEAYVIPQLIRLRGDLSVELLDRSLRELIRRHESLRTAFVDGGEGPRQRVLTSVPVGLEVLGSATDEASALREGESYSLRPFDLGSGVIFRAGLIRLGERDHLLALGIHHIVADGWSLRVLLDELGALYSANVRGAEPALAALPIQYADFARWETARLADGHLDPQVEFWKKQLAGAPPTLDLPTDRPRPARPSHLGAMVDLAVEPMVLDEIRKLARAENATLFLVVLTAFEVLMHRLSGQEDFVVGTPVAGRTRPEFEGLIGFFMNTLALRVDCSGNPTFRELLGRSRLRFLDAWGCQDVSFERLVEELQPERHLDRSPIFQVFINHIVAGMAPPEFEGIQVEPLEQRTSRSKFDLTLYLHEGTGGLRFTMAYDRELFDEARVVEMLAQLMGILRLAVADPERKASAFTLGTERSANRLPDPTQEIPIRPVPTVAEAFAECVARHGERTAIEHGDRRWTYAEVDAISGKLGRWLASRWKGAGTVVAVQGDRSPMTLMVMLAVLRGRGILLTLDPNLPAQRQKLMLDESKAGLLVRIGSLTGTGSGSGVGDSREVLAIGEDGVVPAVGESEALEVSPPDPDAPAYIFFTSGTTGVPKAVLGRHRGLGHFLEWQRRQFEVGPEDRCAQMTGLSFDVVLRDVFTPLTSGAALCLPDRDVEHEPSRLRGWLRSARISMLHVVPSLAESWLEGMQDGEMIPGLRIAFFAGEPLTGTLVDRWRSLAPSSRVVNLYGPTETTLAKCWYEVPGVVHTGVMPVGQPMPETQVWVMGGSGQLCGVGEPGEIVLRTPYRSLGYANSSEETARKFIPNPFGGRSDDRVYLTGDRGRYRPDGLVEILGRMDSQVKIRGVRIELNEVTAPLAAHPDVQTCVVVAREDVPGHKTLVAYFVPRRPDPGLPARLGEHLRRTLPAAYVPSAIVPLEKLPLTANGKVDRKSLPAPAAQAPKVSGGEPRNLTERQVMDLMRELLKSPHHGPEDDFFEAGGHSLLALQVMSRIRRIFGVDVSLRVLFERPTASGVAMAVEEARGLQKQARWHSLAPIQLGDPGWPPLFIFPGGNGADRELYVHSYMAQKWLGSRRPVYALRMRGWNGDEPPHTDIRQMARDYIGEMRSVWSGGPVCLLGDCTGGTIAFEVACQLQATGATVGCLILTDSFRPRRFEYERFVLRELWRSMRRAFAEKRMNEPSDPQAATAEAGSPAVSMAGEAGKKRVGSSAVQSLDAPGQEYWTPLGRHYRRVISRYRPGTFQGKLHLVVSQGLATDSRVLRWQEHATGGAEVIELLDNHWLYLWRHGDAIPGLLPEGKP